MVVIAALIIGAFLAAAISGSAGFGGALLLLPLLTRVAGAEAAVPLLTVAQLLGNAARIGFNFRAIQWRPVGLFLIGALPAAAAGALWFASLPPAATVRLIGAALLTFVILRAAGLLAFKPSPGLLFAGGAVTGLLSGLVGTAGPLGAAIFLSLNLPPLAYLASEAVTALAMHMIKLAVYGTRLDLDPEFWPLALAMGAAMVSGTWAGKAVTAKLSPERFRVLVSVLLAAVAVQMLVTG
ncbi:MAG: TSUP family transporter [Erythrobacter sp.]